MLPRFSNHRRMLLLCLVPLFLVGCGGRSINKTDLADASALATDALLNVLLGPPPAKTVMMMGTPEPPLLKKGEVESVVLATDRKGFAQVSKGALSESDIEAIEVDVLHSSEKILKKRDFTITAVPFPPTIATLPEKTLVATFTPVTEEGGSPDEKKAGRGKIYILIRLTVTDPRTNTVLRIRDFYSGRDALAR